MTGVLRGRSSNRLPLQMAHPLENVKTEAYRKKQTEFTPSIIFKIG
jgi:hypothetical protein